MSFPQLGYQYIRPIYPSDRQGSGGSRSGTELTPSGALSNVLSSMYGAPYAAAAAAQGYGAFLPYTAELPIFPQLGAQYELKDGPGVQHPAFPHHHPAFYPYGQYQFGDPSRPKNATRESTSTLKAWLNEHRKNPYPTKGEKIMLAIITKMTLTQVSTWFANARRRLKKENKMTWAPRNKSEDEDEEEGDAGRSKGGSPGKGPEGHETLAEDEGISLQVDSLTDHSCSAESDGEKLPCLAGDALGESGSEGKEEEDDDDDEGDGDLPAKPAVTTSPLTGVEAPVLSHPPHDGPARPPGKGALDSRVSPAPPTQAAKPKLWSLAEIATSDLKHQSLGQSCQPPALAAATPASAPHSSAYSPSSLLGRHIYYTSPFYSNYTNYGNFNALQSQGILRYNSAAVASNDGLSQTVLNTSSVHKQSTDSLKTITNQLEQHYRSSSYEPKKDPTEVCTVGAQPYL